MQFNAPYNDIPLLWCSLYGSVLPLVQMLLSFVSNEFASIQYFWKKKKENLMQTKEKIDGKVPLTVFWLWNTSNFCEMSGVPQVRV